jgi:hypothetical protein
MQSPHMTSVILAGLGAVFGLAGLLFRWTSSRAFERVIERAFNDPESGDLVEAATRSSAGCATYFLALGLGACAAVLLVAGGIVYLAGH